MNDETFVLIFFGMFFAVFLIMMIFTFTFVFRKQKDGSTTNPFAILKAKKVKNAENKKEKNPCSYCGTLNDNDAYYCKKCGSKLEKEKKCPKCNGLNKSGAERCIYCGEKFDGKKWWIFKTL